MSSNVRKRVTEVMAMRDELHKQFGVRRNVDCEGDLLYGGVAETDLIAKITPLVENYFGKPYKAAGEGAFFKNLFDGFVKQVGGIRKDQTLYRLDLSDTAKLYCAFWPWGSNPIKTTVRIGLFSTDEEEEARLARQLGDLF